VINDSDRVPLRELKRHIKVEAARLPSLLLANGAQADAQQQREALLSLKMKIGRLLEARGWGSARLNAPLPYLAPGEAKRRRLAAEVSALPQALDAASEAERAERLRRVKILCHRMLATLLLLLLGICPICDIFSSMVQN
jgi:hypothetical protein